MNSATISAPLSDGVSTTYAVKIYKQYGEGAIALILSEMVREEQLIRDKDEELLYYKLSFFYSEQHLAKLYYVESEFVLYGDY